MITENDILSMLDLAGTEAAAPAAPLPITSSGGPAPTAPSPLALNVDQWGRRRADELLAANPSWGQLAQADGKALDFDAPHTVADLHAAAFEPSPELLPACTDTIRHDFCKALLDNSDYQALHEQTKADAFKSELATAHFLRKYGDVFRERKKDDIRKRARDAVNRAKGKAPDPQERLREELATARAVQQAVEKAQQDVDDYEAASNAFGHGQGNASGQMDPRATAHLFKAVRHNDELRQIIEWAGRFRRLARSKQRQKLTHGYDDMIGVVLDGDVGRLLPHEMVKLDDPDLELDTLRRLVERQTQCREYQGIEPQGKGPIIVCIDESGSMRGQRIVTAKALGLTMAWVARQQKRWCALCSWSDRGCRRTLALPPGQWDDAALLGWLTSFFNGGTEPPLDDMPAIYAKTQAPAGKTDIVMVTDGVCNIAPDEAARFLAWKATAKARMLTVGIGNHPGTLAHVSDETYTVTDLTAETEAVGRAVSI